MSASAGNLHRSEAGINREGHRHRRPLSASPSITQRPVLSFSSSVDLFFDVDGARVCPAAAYKAALKDVSNEHRLVALLNGKVSDS